MELLLPQGFGSFFEEVLVVLEELADVDWAMEEVIFRYLNRGKSYFYGNLYFCASF